MWFNIIMSNHMDPVIGIGLREIVRYVREALSTCGHDVTIVWEKIEPNAINVFFEFFPDDNKWAAKFRELREQGVVIGIITTELMVEDAIPYAEHGIHNSQGGLASRMSGFYSVIKEVDFVWSVLARTADAMRGKTAISEFFPVGSVAGPPAEVRRAPKDIDVVFCGKMTPHRQDVLRTINRHGIDVVAVGGGFPLGHVPDLCADSLLDRAKIGLNLTLCAENESPVSADPRFASCVRVVQMLNRNLLVVSEEIPLDNPYKDYMESGSKDSIAMICKRALAEGRWRKAGKDNGEKFRRAMDAQVLCGPVIDRTLASIKDRLPSPTKPT